MTDTIDIDAEIAALEAATAPDYDEMLTAPMPAFADEYIDGSEDASMDAPPPDYGDEEEESLEFDPMPIGVRCIAEYAVTEEVTSGTFNNLLTLAADFASSMGYTVEAAESFADSMSHSEDEWILGIEPNPARYASGEKMGEIRKAKYLPSTYAQARDVLISALGYGVEFRNADGQAMGKSAIEAANKAARNAALPVSDKAAKAPEDKIRTMLDSIIKLLPQCADNGAAMAAIIRERITSY